MAIAENSEVRLVVNKRPLLVWGLSFGIWTFIALVAGVSQFNRSTDVATSLIKTFGPQFCQMLTYAPLTPFAFTFAIRRPVQLGNWVRCSLLHLAGGMLFTAGHVVLRGMTPYGVWDWQLGEWVSAVGHLQGHLQIHWPIYGTMLYSSFFDDITSAYVPIVLIAQAVSYHQRFRLQWLRTSQLEAQLAKEHLRALKSQLQPHFLFNTLHSISALMLTDVIAADRMMTRLSDLLRMNLDDRGAQITTLSRELDFVNSYLEIEKVRFGDRLTVILDIDPNTLDAQVPHLLLQPLVENAVRHGIANLSSGGKIRIAASHDDRSLYLQIRDNGPGLVKRADERLKSGLGLRATRERLRTLYGDDQEIDIRNEAEGGVEVNARIPLTLDPAPSEFEMTPYGDRNGLGESS